MVSLKEEILQENMEEPLQMKKELESQFENSIVDDAFVDKSFLANKLNLNNGELDINQFMSLSEKIKSEMSENEINISR